MPEESAAEEAEPGVEASKDVGFNGISRFDEIKRCVSACLRTIEADFDGDGKLEHLCAREAWVQTRQCRTPYHRLVLDLSRGKEKLLRQQLNPGVFWEERLYFVGDLDGDGRAELVTRLQLSPDCSGCTTYSIYTFTGDYFEEVASLFGVSPRSPQVGRVMRAYNDILDRIETRYRSETGRDNPCGYGQEPSSCVAGPTWLLDSDGDGRVEIVQLMDSPVDDYFLKPRYYRLAVMELGPKGAGGPLAFYPLRMDGMVGSVSLLGFLKTRNGRVHALINFGYPGTSTAYPILNVFEVRGIGVKWVAELYGFYEHVVPDRMWDVDQDGNTEIIHVPSDYWPPGKSHAEVILNYEIMEYRKGKYVPARPEIRDVAVLQEDEEEDE
jgi:hypothetical protein